jgi:hypothetical protein
LQLSFTTATKRRSRMHLYENREKNLSLKIQIIIETWLDAVFGTDAWVVLLAFVFQDFPFLIIRLIIAVNFSLEKNYLLYYLCGKNILLCFIEIYQIGVLIYERLKEEIKEEKEKTEKDEEKSKDGESKKEKHVHT